MKKSLSVLFLGAALTVAGCSHQCDKQASLTEDQHSCSNKTLAHFAFDSAELSQSDKEDLMKVANKLKKYPNKKVHISGYADSTGSADYNKELSEERAQNAATYLKSLGISGDRISITGYGATHFKSANDTADERAQNRRIEVSIH